MSGVVEASLVIPPRQGKVTALAVTTSASAVQDLGAQPGTGRYFTFYCDQICYLTFHSSSTITDPDSTSTTGNAQTFPIPGGVPISFEIDLSSRYFKARGAAAGTLRWYGSGR